MVCLRGCSAVPLHRKTSCVHTLLMVSISNISNNSSPWHPSDFQSVTLGSIKSYLYFFHGTNCNKIFVVTLKSWTTLLLNNLSIIIFDVSLITLIFDIEFLFYLKSIFYFWFLILILILPSPGPI